jgi:hypothetical protein
LLEKVVQGYFQSLLFVLFKIFKNTQILNQIYGEKSAYFHSLVTSVFEAYKKKTYIKIRDRIRDFIKVVSVSLLTSYKRKCRVRNVFFACSVHERGQISSENLLTCLRQSFELRLK